MTLVSTIYHDSLTMLLINFCPNFFFFSVSVAAICRDCGHVTTVIRIKNANSPKKETRFLILGLHVSFLKSFVGSEYNSKSPNDDNTINVMARDVRLAL